MRVWLIQDGETLPYLNESAREMRCASIANALVKDGAEVLWWASTFEHSSKKYLFSKATTISPAPGLTIRLLHGPGYRRNQSPARIIHQRAIARAFLSEVSGLPLPDVIVANLPYPEMAEQAIIVGGNAKVPVIVFVEDMWPDIYLTMIPKCFRWLGRILLGAEFRRIRKVFGSAKAIFAVSDTYLEWGLRYAGRKQSSLDAVFPLGYPAPQKEISMDRQELRQKYGVAPEKIVVAFAGMFGFSYDLETVVRAAKILTVKGESRVHFVLIGDGDSSVSLRGLAEGDANITFTGWLNHHSVHELLVSSDIGLAAYHARATQTLPYKPFEYMAAGLPLLSSLPGELNELIRREKIGISYDACDAESLSDAILGMISDRRALSEMGRRSLELFRARYSTEVICPKVVRQMKLIAGK